MIILYEDAQTKEAKFAAMVEKRNNKLIGAGHTDGVKSGTYTGAPPYGTQIWTSIKSVFFGLLFTTVVTVPLGIAAGLSATAVTF